MLVKPNVMSYLKQKMKIKFSLDMGSICNWSTDPYTEDFIHSTDR